MDEPLAGSVEDADVQRPGVQIDPAVVAVLLRVESHSVLSLRGCALQLSADPSSSTACQRSGAMIARPGEENRMPSMPTGNPEQFYQGAPLLLVPDVLATAEYYRKVLGFMSDPGATTPEYSVVWRDNAAIHLAKGAQLPAGVRIFFWVKDVNGLYEDVTKQGVEIAIPIETRPYKIRDFSIRDPNGVLLVFGQNWY